MDVTTNSGPERTPRALVLEGDPVALDIVQRSLEARSLATLSAADGTKGLEILLDELLHLDVVVMDVDLPQRDARSFARLVRLAGGERDLALVVVAGELDPGLRAELLAVGVDAIADWREGPRAIADVVVGVLRSRRPPSATAAESVVATSVATPAAPPRPRLGLGGWSLLPA